MAPFSKFPRRKYSNIVDRGNSGLASCVRSSALTERARRVSIQPTITLLGFNETRRCDGCDTIVEIQFADRWYPLLAARALGRGRVTAWTTGASPHWGVNFVKWPQLNQFWRQVFSTES